MSEQDTGRRFTGSIPLCSPYAQEEPVAVDNIPPPAESGRRPRRSDSSGWNWLLLLPLLVTLYPPLYNRRDPELAGIPFFYWYQLAVISVGVACTYVVYRRTRG